MDWAKYKKGYHTFLKLEKSLSVNTINAYLTDLNKLISYFNILDIHMVPEKVEYSHLMDFIVWTGELGMGPRSQARMVSGIKSFFKYLLIEEIIAIDPAELIEAPKPGRKLPVVLSIQEIDRIIEAIDLSKPD